MTIDLMATDRAMDQDPISALRKHETAGMYGFSSLFIPPKYDTTQGVQGRGDCYGYN